MSGTKPKFISMAGVHRHQLATRASGNSRSSLPGTSANGLPSRSIRLIMKVGRKIGLKKAWSKNVRFTTAEKVFPGKRIMSVEYQRWTTGATRQKPRIPNLPVRIRSGAKDLLAVGAVPSSIDLILSLFLLPSLLIWFLYTKYWQRKSPLAAIIPDVMHLVDMG